VLAGRKWKSNELATAQGVINTAIEREMIFIDETISQILDFPSQTWSFDRSKTKF
jgi:N-acetyl-beta-hexosaminidase